MKNQNQSCLIQSLEQRNYGAYGSSPSGAVSMITQRVSDFVPVAPTINTGATQMSTVALGGAHVGDVVVIGATPNPAPGVILAGVVQSEGILEVRISNTSAAAASLFQMNLEVVLIKPAPGN